MAHPGKVGRPLARFACCVRNVRFESICAILGLEPSHQAAVVTAERSELLRRFSPRCPRRSVVLAC